MPEDIIRWLKDICKVFGDGMTRLVTQAIKNVPLTDELKAHNISGFLSYLVLEDSHLKQEVRDELHAFYFQMLADLEFKSHFAQGILEQYLNEKNTGAQI